jgi:multisubunit Na+/H+ antiporter MnhB subunit
MRDILYIAVHIICYMIAENTNHMTKQEAYMKRQSRSRIRRLVRFIYAQIIGLVLAIITGFLLYRYSTLPPV